MIRMVIFAIALSMTIQSCNGQKKETDKNLSQNLPQTNIKVNKEYDKNGNIIKYDSAYSSYCFNIKGDTVLRDSIFDNFKSHFNRKYFFSTQPYFNSFFFEDSLLGYDFYKKDFFYNRFRYNSQFMDELFHEMDSIKNSFYNQQFKIPYKGSENKGNKD